MQDAKRATGRDAEGERHAIGVTRMCLRSGTVQLPFALAGRLPEGELLVHDVESDEPVVLWSEPPRRLAGLSTLFERHELQVNDQVVLDLQGDEVRLSVAKRPRRSRPKVTPSTWVSHRDEPAPAPSSADAADEDGAEPPTEAPSGREARSRRDAAATGLERDLADAPDTPSAEAAEPLADAPDDDVPRAPRVRTKAREATSTDDPATEPHASESRGPFSGLMRAARGWFGGRRGEDPPSEPREPDWLDAWKDETASSDDETRFTPTASPAAEPPPAAGAGPDASAEPDLPSEAPEERSPHDAPRARGVEMPARFGDAGGTSARTQRDGRAAPQRDGRSAAPGEPSPSASPAREGRRREPIVRDLSAPEPSSRQPRRPASPEAPSEQVRARREQAHEAERARATREPEPAPPSIDAPRRERPPRPVPEPDTEHGTRPPSTPLWPAWDEEPDTWTGDEADVDAAADGLFRAPPRTTERERTRPAQEPKPERTHESAQESTHESAHESMQEPAQEPMQEPAQEPPPALDASEPPEVDRAEVDRASPPDLPDDAETAEPDGPTLPSGVPVRAERFLGGDLRTRLVRFLISPDMPLIAKTEMIAKRFDLDPTVARDMLEDVAEDPPPGLRLTPVREGAWRIERTRS